MIRRETTSLIRHWADRHSAVPAEIKRLKHDGEPAILTFIIGTRMPLDRTFTYLLGELLRAIRPFEALHGFRRGNVKVRHRPSERIIRINDGALN